MEVISHCNSCVNKRLQSEPLRFEFPTPTGKVRLHSVLDLDNKCSAAAAERNFSQTALRNLEAAKDKWSNHGIDIRKKCIAVDVMASAGRQNSMKGVLPCLTASRASGGGFYLPALGRFTTTEEMGKCQGMSVADMPWQETMTEKQFRHALGNAMSQNVLEALLPKVLSSAGL